VLTCSTSGKGDAMDVVRVAPLVTNLETELLASYPNLTRRLALVLRDESDAQDIAQDAFARALEQRHRFAGGDARAWFYTIGLRLAFNQLRRRKTAVALGSTDEPQWAMATEPDLWKALGQLEPNQRAALLLSILDGYTHEEISRMFRVRPGTVSSWVSRAKDRLRATLGDDEK
jgi:RNA polymerase sigma-70 factor (ECF subfamily)